jgi:hypothetical protein
MLCHLAALAGFLPMMPFLAVAGPLVVWLVKKDEYPFVNTQGKAAINFQLSMLIYGAFAILLALACGSLGIGIVLFLAVVISDLILTIIAAIKANEGESFQYPVSFTFIR